jgi:hypothetical protein
MRCVTTDTLRHYSSYDVEALRNWRVDASTDGVTWTTLREHVDDAALAAKGASHTWVLTSPACDEFYTHFRVFMTGKNSNTNWYLALSGFELYGTLRGPGVGVGVGVGVGTGGGGGGGASAAAMANKWTRLGVELNSGLHRYKGSPTMACVDNKLYLVGSNASDQVVVLSHAEKSRDCSVTKTSPPPQPMYGNASIAYKKCIYSFGGKYANKSYVSDIVVYNTRRDSWTVLQSKSLSPAPSPSSSPSELVGELGDTTTAAIATATTATAAAAAAAAAAVTAGTAAGANNASLPPVAYAGVALVKRHVFLHGGALQNGRVGCGYCKCYRYCYCCCICCCC